VLVAVVEPLVLVALLPLQLALALELAQVRQLVAS